MTTGSISARSIVASDPCANAEPGSPVCQSAERLVLQRFVGAFHHGLLELLPAHKAYPFIYQGLEI